MITQKDERGNQTMWCCNWRLLQLDSETTHSRRFLLQKTVKLAIRNRSDCAPAIRAAVEVTFPDTEWSPCAVHVSRSLQKLWNDHHGELSRQNRENVEDFNRFVGLFWKACLSVAEEEANEWLAMMEEMERELDG